MQEICVKNCRIVQNSQKKSKSSKKWKKEEKRYPHGNMPKTLISLVIHRVIHIIHIRKKEMGTNFLADFWTNVLWSCNKKRKNKEKAGKSRRMKIWRKDKSFQKN